jgi:succinyl-CoA synthetase beta subunit
MKQDARNRRAFCVIIRFFSDGIIQNKDKKNGEWVCMKLHEYQSKQIFAKYGIPIPKGRVAATADEAKTIAEELGSRVVIKAQVLVGGRGKAGGIRLAKTPEEAREVATQILSMEIKGLPVRKVLVDEAAGIEKEIYLGVTNDRTARKPVMMASAAGGVEIEEVAKNTPEKIIKVYLHPLLGLQDYQSRDLAVGIDLPKEHWRTFGKIAHGLWRAFIDCDATLAEINPLVITSDNNLSALDGKMVIDDNALFRHNDLAEMRDLDVEAPSEIEARKYGLSYIKLDGNIGCMVNGAGLAMTTMDIIKLYGGEPANFLDICGGASAEKVAAALRIILSDPNVKAVLFNVFGGITRGDEVAHGILAALNEVKTHVPMVTRLVGTNAEEGRQILANAEMITAQTLAEAAEKSVAVAKGINP